MKKDFLLLLVKVQIMTMIDLPCLRCADDTKQHLNWYLDTNVSTSALFSEYIVFALICIEHLMTQRCKPVEILITDNYRNPDNIKPFQGILFISCVET